MADAGMQLPALAKPMSTGEPSLGSCGPDLAYVATLMLSLHTVASREVILHRAVPNDDHAAHGNGAHELSVIRTADGLQQLLDRCTHAAEAAVLQPFIAHGPCMYKVRYDSIHTSAGTSCRLVPAPAAQPAPVFCCNMPSHGGLGSHAPLCQPQNTL